MDKGAVNKKETKKKKMVLSFLNVRRSMSNRTEGLSRHHLEGIAAASVVIATWFFIYWKGKERNQPKKRTTFHRSLTIGALHGGRLAMQRILDAQHARVDASVLDGAQAQLDLLLHLKPLDFIRLQVGWPIVTFMIATHSSKLCEYFKNMIGLTLSQFGSGNYQTG